MALTNNNLMIGMISLEESSKIGNEILDFENLINKKVAFLLRYISLGNDFPINVCRIADKHNCIPVFTWELNNSSANGDGRRECLSGKTDLDDILNGEYDWYFKVFAKNAMLWSKQVQIKLLHEFNSNWYVWSGSKNGGPNGGSDKVKRVWIYIVDLFRNIGANNIKWIWCPHEPSFDVSLEKWNDIENYWPGDDYVDIMGIDGFNFYPENPERPDPDFLNFNDLFLDTYNKLIKISDKPISIMTGSGEFNCSGPIKNKPEWIKDALCRIKDTYPQVNTLFWFNYHFDEKANWRVDSSIESLKMFKDKL